MSIPRNNSKARGNNGVIGVIVVIAILVAYASNIFNARPRQVQPPTPAQHVPTAPAQYASPVPMTNPIEEMLKSPAVAARVDGIGLAVLMDVSGSMGQSVKGASGAKKSKIEIARNSARNIITKVQQFAEQNPGKSVQVAIYEFSSRENSPSCRNVVPLGPPDAASADAAISAMYPKGGTPIGDAIIKAKQDLTAAGLTKQHILVVTDGENNQGYSPQDVVNAIARLGENDAASVYFVAFNVSESKFKSVRDAGGLVLAAADETQLDQTLDYVLTGRVLVEQPESPGTR
jgi:hypothetical protein